jgi:hypothetical protein
LKSDIVVEDVRSIGKSIGLKYKVDKVNVMEELAKVDRRGRCNGVREK